MFQKFQQLKELKRMRDQAMEMQRALEQESVTVEKDEVKVIMTGNQKITKLEFEGDVDPDKVADVINDALKESQKVAAKKLQEMGGGLQGLLGSR
ncbi:hypothetical protein CMO96_01955 [Candidatus Woesebacteria bacterium]|nr:hypothetical protein [Candidatus Woesebacteria bacterium]|tara:strand:- start:132 stop:416 length:285 start_codon:yes stop_codon:yes gene_type:complete